MNINIRKILLDIGIMALVVWTEPWVWSAGTDQVACTVTAQKISVSVSDGSVAYGTIALGSSQDTTASGVNDSQTATNDGNVAEDFNIEGVDTTGWTLAAATGSDQYVHEFSTDSGSNWTALTTSYQTLATNIASSSTQTFDLRVWVPSSTTHYDEQNPNVTIQASAHSS